MGLKTLLAKKYIFYMEARPTYRRLWVRLRTMSRNSWDVGTGAMSFHVVFMVPGAVVVVLLRRAGGREGCASESAGAVSIEAQKKFRARDSRSSGKLGSTRLIGRRRPATTYFTGPVVAPPKS